MFKTPLTNHTLKAIMTYKACNTYPTTMVKTTSQLLLNSPLTPAIGQTLLQVSPIDQSRWI